MHGQDSNSGKFSLLPLSLPLYSTPHFALARWPPLTLRARPSDITALGTSTPSRGGSPEDFRFYSLFPCLFPTHFLLIICIYIIFMSGHFFSLMCMVSIFVECMQHLAIFLSYFDHSPML